MVTPIQNPCDRGDPAPCGVNPSFSYTRYPCDIDDPRPTDTRGLPVIIDLTTPVRAEVVNRHREAILAVESELGIQPSGTFTTVRDRLDALEGLLCAVWGSDVTVIGGGTTAYEQELHPVTSTGQTTFTLTKTPIASEAVSMFVDGVSHTYGVDYTVTDDVVTYINNPPDNPPLQTTQVVVFKYFTEISVDGPNVTPPLEDVLAEGATTGGTSIRISSGDSIIGVGGTLSLSATTVTASNALTIGSNLNVTNNATVGGTLNVAGTITPSAAQVTISKSLTVNTNLSVTGNATIGGKLTVTGLIDPTGLVLDEQASVPTTPASDNAVLWYRSSDGYMVVSNDAHGDIVLDGSGGGDPGGGETLAETLAIGNETGGYDIVLTSDGYVKGETTLSGQGGDVYISSGSGPDGSGNILIQTHLGSSPTYGGDIILNASNAAVAANRGVIRLQVAGGNALLVNYNSECVVYNDFHAEGEIQGVHSSLGNYSVLDLNYNTKDALLRGGESSNVGGDVFVWGGDGASGGNGGSVYIKPGTTSGTGGSVYLQTESGSNVVRVSAENINAPFELLTDGYIDGNLELGGVFTANNQLFPHYSSSSPPGGTPPADHSVLWVRNSDNALVITNSSDVTTVVSTGSPPTLNEVLGSGNTTGGESISVDSGFISFGASPASSGDLRFSTFGSIVQNNSGDKNIANWTNTLLTLGNTSLGMRINIPSSSYFRVYSGASQKIGYLGSSDTWDIDAANVNINGVTYPSGTGTTGQTLVLTAADTAEWADCPVTLSEVLTNGNNAGSENITNLADPVSLQDAATKAWVENQLASIDASIVGNYSTLKFVHENITVTTIGQTQFELTYSPVLAYKGYSTMMFINQLKVELADFDVDGYTVTYSGSLTLTPGTHDVEFYYPIAVRSVTAPTFYNLLSGIDSNDSSTWKVVGMTEIDSTQVTGDASLEVVLYSSDGYADGYARLYNVTTSSQVGSIVNTSSSSPELLTTDITLDGGSNIYSLQVKVEQDGYGEDVFCGMGRVRLDGYTVGSKVLSILSGVVTEYGNAWTDIGFIEIDPSEYDFTTASFEVILSSSDGVSDGYLVAQARLVNVTTGDTQIGSVLTSESGTPEVVSQTVVLDAGSNIYAVQLRLSEDGGVVDFATCSMARVILE